MNDAGEIAPAGVRFHEDRNRLLRSLGSREHRRPAIRPEPQPIARDDAFLRPTDGFWEYAPSGAGTRSHDKLLGYRRIHRVTPASPQQRPAGPSSLIL